MNKPTVVCLCGVELTGLVETRFWSKVKKGNLDECWEWQASLSKKGYGQFKLGGHPAKTALAHMVSLRR